MKKWTDDEKQILTDMYLAGESITKIANKLSRTIAQVRGFIERNKHRMPDEKQESKIRHQVRTRNLDEKPTPETVTIQYEFTEYPMPEEALMIPFKDVKPGQCGWLSGGFWDEPHSETPCCGLPVYDPNGKGLRRQYCEFHYKISIEEVKK